MKIDKNRTLRHLSFLTFILLGGITIWGCIGSFKRVPELPVQQFFQKQLEALPQGWVLSKPELWTDTDFTWALWAVAVNFEYKDGIHFAGEEIHIFATPHLAQTIKYPSAPSTSAGEGFVPRGWSYRPPHADRFDFGCRGEMESQPQACTFIVRYKEYIIVFGTPIGDFMTLEHLQQLLELIDQEMIEFLQHSTLQPGSREVPKVLDP